MLHTRGVKLTLLAGSWQWVAGCFNPVCANGLFSVGLWSVMQDIPVTQGPKQTRHFLRAKALAESRQLWQANFCCCLSVIVRERSCFFGRWRADEQNTKLPRHCVIASRQLNNYANFALVAKHAQTISSLFTCLFITVPLTQVPFSTHCPWKALQTRGSDRCGG